MNSHFANIKNTPQGITASDCEVIKGLGAFGVNIPILILHNLGLRSPTKLWEPGLAIVGTSGNVILT